MKLWNFGVFLLVLAAEPASGQDVGDPESGEMLANEICADCHSVEPGRAVSPVVEAPSFQAISNKPEISELALTVFFQTPHPSMPNLILPSEDVRDLVAYILSLTP